MAERYCAYCQNYRPDEGFITVLHSSSNTRRSQCTRCQAVRKRPLKELRDLAIQERNAKKTKR